MLPLFVMAYENIKGNVLSWDIDVLQEEIYLAFIEFVLCFFFLISFAFLIYFMAKGAPSLVLPHLSIQLRSF